MHRTPSFEGLSIQIEVCGSARGEDMYKHSQHMPLISGIRSALASLMWLYADEGPGAWRYTHPLFSQLNEVLDANKIPVKETLLVTAGLIGQ